jgi:beta-barrel assembly-enhancing protease
MIRRTQTRRGGRGGRGGCGGRLLMAALIAISSIIMYFSSQQENPITWETQYVDLTVNQEISMGLQAAPELAAQFGGIDPNPDDRALVEQIGNRLVNQSPAERSPYVYEFHLLADPETINAFALPGGQIFITRALYDQLQTEGELAGVLGHEIGHVVARHSAQQIAKAKLTQGLTGAAVIAAYDPDNPRSIGTAQLAALVGQMINMKYGRDDELESDFLGVCFLNDAGYDPNELIRVMEVLAGAREGPAPPEFFSTHPDPGNRIERIQQNIQNLDRCPQ